MAGFQGGDDAGGGFDREIGEILALQRAGPRIEQFHHFGPGLHLHRQIFDCRLGDAVDQRGKAGTVLGFQCMGGGLVAGATPGDHVAGDGPGCSGKADKGGRSRQCAGQDAQGFVDRGKVVVDGIGGFQRLHPGHCGDGGQARPLAGLKPQVRPKGLRQQQDIGEQDGGVKPIAANRLQGDLRRQIGIVAQRQEIPRLRPCGAVFGQIAARLPHHPDRRNRQHFTGQGAQDQFLGHVGLRPGSVSAGLSWQLSGRIDSGKAWP